MTDNSQIDPRLQYQSTAPFAPNAPLSTANPGLPASNDSNDLTKQPYYVPAASRGRQNSSATLDPALQRYDEVHEGSADENASPEDGANDGSPPKPGEAKRPRACDSCRGLKVRCDQDPSHLELPCKRCAKAGRACITTPPTRKRAKKADSRVAELERKIDALTATLHAQRAGALPTPDARAYGPDTTSSTTISHGESPYQQLTPHFQKDQGPYPGTQPSEWTSSLENYAGQTNPYVATQPSSHSPVAKKRRIDETRDDLYGETEATEARRDMAASDARDFTKLRNDVFGPRSKPPNIDHSDISRKIDEIIDEPVAESIYNRYVNHVFPQFPAVPPPAGMTAKECREKKPILFLSIIAGTSYGANVPPDYQRELNKLLKDQLADIVFRNGEKSLEIIQALQVTVFWYRPPAHFEQHNFYLIANIAAVCAVDLGLGRDANATKKFGFGPHRRNLPDANSIEARRSFLVCYYLCMNITMVLRRPILLRWTKYMEESVRLLETSPEALPSDRNLAQHIRLSHLCEDIAVQFCMDEPSADLSIQDPKVICSMKIFEKELNTLRTKFAEQDKQAPITVTEHVINLYIHEIALHNSYNIDEFRVPYMDVSKGSQQHDQVFSPGHISALSQCITACHGIIDTWTTLDFGVLYVLPMMTCVRAIYAVVCLIKLWVTIASVGENISHAIPKETVRVEESLDKVINIFQTIVDRDPQSPQFKFLFVTRRLKEKFEHIKEGGVREGMCQYGNGGSPAPEQQTSQAQAHPKSEPSNSQTPLHLLSDVAIGSSNTPASTDASSSTRGSQQQPFQPPASTTATGGWYDAAAINPTLQPPSQPQQIVGGIDGFDMNLDISNFDFNFNNFAINGDMSGLFTGDTMWSWEGLEQGYGNPAGVW